MSKPLFQKRHYELTARLFREAYSSKVLDYGVVSVFVDEFKSDNPKFNEDKFWRTIEHGNTKP